MRLGDSAASRQEEGQGRDRDDGVDPSMARLLTHYVSLRRLPGCSAIIAVAKKLSQKQGLRLFLCPSFHGRRLRSETSHPEGTRRGGL